MQDTYKAVEVSAPGTLRLVERPVKEPGAGQVRIRVEACGVCHSDAATVMGAWPGLTLPRVPGHELVGRYFDPRAVTAVPARREQVSELLKLPFNFIFFTGSTKVG